MYIRDRHMKGWHLFMINISAFPIEISLIWSHRYSIHSLKFTGILLINWAQYHGYKQLKIELELVTYENMMSPTEVAGARHKVKISVLSSLSVFVKQFWKTKSVEITETSSGNWSTILSDMLWAWQSCVYMGGLFRVSQAIFSPSFTKFNKTYDW